MRLIVFGRLHSPHKMCFLHLLLLVLGLGLPLAVVSLATPPYMREDLFKICPKDGSKKAISLGTKAAILTLQAESLTRAFNCHLELEAPSGYGLHTYIQEMGFRGDEELNDCSDDYVQFGRDVFAFTVYRSPKFCGHRPSVNFSSPEDSWKKFKGNMNRFHIEERDHEMDLWLRLGSAKASDQHRNLTLVVTVFKKNCNARDPHFRHCRHTDYCVRNEYFCDSYANCAWPSGDSATDEDYCDGSEWVPSGFGSGMSNGALNASNIPIIIIVIIVVVGVIIVFAVGISHFIKTFKASSPSDELSGSSATSSATRANRRPRPSGQEASAPMLLSEGSGGPASPSAPPSYEEALKTQPVVMTVDPKLDPPELPAHPPPYSEQAETRTGFI